MTKRTVVLKQPINTCSVQKLSGLSINKLMGIYMGVLIHLYYSLSTGKDHASVASIGRNAVGTSDNVAPDE